MSVTTITPQRLHELISKGEPAELIDVRTPVEFREVHVAIARNVPLTELDAKKIATTRNDESPLYIICKSGGRSLRAAEFLVEQGVVTVNVAGGTMAWIQGGHPVVTGDRPS
jgi:rhodanese-related sulfurtransferase